MASTVELIKERLDIVEVISSYIKLEKAGINMKARCPFHNEKTPSFSVSPSRGSFYCFGCGEKGDMFTFVEKFEGVDFKGALKILAERAGVEIVYEKSGKNREEQEEKDELYAILEDAAAFFEKNLKGNKGVLDYLKKRGLTIKTIEEFRLGYAENEWRSLLSFLRRKKHTDALIEKTGLIKRGEESGAKDYYDRFRGRIMFPIMDPSGRVVAFSGRIYEPALRPKEEPGGKYINSPETTLFSKSKILYGYDKAKEGIRKWTFAILVEGQMDLLMSHQAGFKNTIALSGTALTGEQLTLISRFTQKLVLALDADPAGIAASGKSASLALSRGFDVKAAKLKEGKDPADLVKTDPELWRKSVREASHIIEFYLDVIESKGLDERKFAQEVTKTVIPYVADIGSPIDRAHFISKIASRLRLPEKAIIDEVDISLRRKKDGSAVALDGIFEKETSLGRKRKTIDRIAGLLFAEESLKKGRLDAKALRKRLKDILGKESFEEIISRVTLSPDILFEGETHYENEEILDSEIDRLVLSLRSLFLKEKYESLMRDLRGHEKKNEVKETKRILEECDRISKELTDIDKELKK